MGATQSTKPLEGYSKEEIAEVVASYGGKYKHYRKTITENGMDGSFLATLCEEEFRETMDDLDISQRLHRRKLMNEFRKSRGISSGSSRGKSCSSSSHDEHDSTNSSDVSEA